MNVDPSSFGAVDDEEEAGPKWVHFPDGVALDVPGCSLIPEILRLINCRVLCVPTQRHFAEHRRIQKYLEIPLGAICSIKINVRFQ